METPDVPFRLMRLDADPPLYRIERWQKLVNGEMGWIPEGPEMIDKLDAKSELRQRIAKAENKWVEVR